jgi:hypothetical protein
MQSCVAYSAGSSILAGLDGVDGMDGVGSGRLGIAGTLLAPAIFSCVLPKAVKPNTAPMAT